MAKYDQLADHLNRSGADELTLTVAEVDELVEGLPPSAYERREWWANDTVGHVHSRAWLEAVCLHTERTLFPTLPPTSTMG